MDVDENEDLVLSEIHMLTAPPSATGSRIWTQFQQYANPLCETCLSDNSFVNVDSDGDLEVVRRCRACSIENTILIKHGLQTTIADVGLQVWKGAFVLADYMVTHSTEFINQTVVELGAGVGFLSVVMSHYASHVYATDVGDDILANCFENLQANACEKNVKVRVFDWLGEDPFHMESASNSPFSWSPQERDDVCFQSSIFVAADVIYDDTLTEAFLDKISNLFNSSPNHTSLILSMEKRINFTLDALDVRAPAYDFFMTQVKRFGLVVTQIPINFAQHFQYKRDPQLVLMRITTR